MVTLPRHQISDLPGEWVTVGLWIEAAEIESELARETTAGHPLFDTQVQAVAVRGHLKEVVFWLPEDRKWAWVHLTWNIETSPRWPTTEIAEGWEELVHALVD